MTSAREKEGGSAERRDKDNCKSRPIVHRDMVIGPRDPGRSTFEAHRRKPAT